MTPDPPQCARCAVPIEERRCQNPTGRHPRSCPTLRHPQTVERAVAQMLTPEIKEFARQASIQEGQGYSPDPGAAAMRPVKPRIQETLEFVGRMGYRRLGLAFCLGLVEEARAVDGLLRQRGLEVVSALCKAGCTPKESIGVRDREKICPGTPEPLCNPVAQAFLLNEAHTDFNIVMGLCVGHDALFLKYSRAMCTVLAVKDRVTGHNPLAAIYTLQSYYAWLK